MGNIGEGATVNESRCSLQGLNQVRINGLPEERGHRPISSNITGIDWLAIH